MKVTTVKKKRARAKVRKIQFSEAAFQLLLVKLKDDAVREILPVAVEIGLTFKHGDGLIGNHLQNQYRDSALAAMRPLEEVVRYSAVNTAAAFLNGLVADRNLRDYLIRRSAAMAGRCGGRPVGSKERHTLWLEERLKKQAARSYTSDMTASDHFEELRHADEIDENDDGNLIITCRTLEEWNWPDDKPPPVITTNSVKEALTRIRKKS